MDSISKDIPDEKLNLPPAVASSEDTTSQPANSVPGDMPDHEAERREAEVLGLRAKDPNPKAGAKKRKRSVQESLLEDLEAVDAQFEALVLSLDTFMDSKSFGQELGKLDRIIQRKVKEACTT